MQDLVEKLADLMQKKGITLVTAESCTGGLLAATITLRPGTSKMFERGFITYSNESKTEMLGVPKDLIDKYGAVSEEVAQSMAQGALEKSRADLSISITGIAGPDGGSEHKPVGLVYFGYAMKGKSAGIMQHMFKGTRKQIQAEATQTALKHLISVLDKEQE
jgi:nicotinamide-nucleotide amidase